MTWLAWLVAPAFAWPLESDWLPVQRQGSPLEDPSGETTVGDDSLDLFGSATDAAAFWYADGDGLYLRARVMGDPQTMTGAFRAQDWGFLLELNGDDAFEYALIAESASGDLRAYPNATDTPGTQPGFENYGQPWLLGDIASGHVRRELGSGSTFFVDFWVTAASLNDLGIAPDAPLRLTAVTGPSIYIEWTDLAGCLEVVTECDALDEVLSDTVFIDRDRDGLTDPVELAEGTDPTDADSDEDGLLDGEEPLGDADGDGLVNALDCDADGDGLLDSVEAGLVHSDLTAATDAGSVCFEADQDPSTTTDPFAEDSDLGGLPDGVEDWNHNGAIDAWETDPNDSSDDVDSDGDLIADVLEAMGDDGDVVDVDSDGDGIPDADEWLFDTDGDGVPNFLDLDSDDDGLPDADEGFGDRDGDGVPNSSDLDSDGDGIPDAVEGGVDSDGDGADDSLDLDSDGDGILDEVEGEDDFDGDGIPDYLDEDSDGDGLLDEVEGRGDPDGDGQPNFNDLDSDDDGLPDDYEGADDPDLDGAGNFEDTNSDGQGASDGVEGTGDRDCDGIENWLDQDEEDSFCDEPQPDPGIQPGPEVPEDPDALDFDNGDFTGGSCSMTGNGGLFALPLLLAAALMRRRRSVVAGGLLAVGSTAAAQDINAQRFSPSVDGTRFVKTEDLQLQDAFTPTAAAWVNIADDPFVFRPSEGDEVDVLGSVATMNVTGSYSFGFARIGVDLPIHMMAVGFDVDHPTHLGDLRLSGKARGLRQDVAGWELRLGATADAILPTGNPNAWVGSGTAWVRGGLVGQLSRDRWRFATNLGMRSGTGAQFGDLSVRPGMLWSGGASYAITQELTAAVELDGEFWLANGGNPGRLPLEWLASGRYAPGRSWDVTAGVGSGLTRGVGAPDVRVLAGVRWTPIQRDFQEDVLTVAPMAAPGPGHLVVRVDNPYGQAVHGAKVRVIGETATLERPTRSDGASRIDLPAGDYRVEIDAAGYTLEERTVSLRPDGSADMTVLLHPDQVVVDTDAGRVFLHRKVFFELDRAELKVESLSVLDDLIVALANHPEIARLRIEGHTDIQGTDAHNDKLSTARANAVVAYLVENGVAPERLVAKGLGERRVLQEGDSDDVHATNRRVEFHIEQLGPVVSIEGPKRSY